MNNFHSLEMEEEEESPDTSSDFAAVVEEEEEGCRIDSAVAAEGHRIGTQVGEVAR